MCEKKAAYEKRIEKVRQNMKEEGQDILFLTPSSYMKYMTGYSIRGDERFLTWILPREGPVLAVGNALYQQQMADIPADRFCFWNDGEDPYKLTATVLGEEGIKVENGAVDPNMPARFSMRLQDVLPQCHMRDGSVLMDSLRLYKDETERKLMAEGCKRADQALRHTIGNGTEWLGRTEEEFLAKLVYEMTKLGIQNGAACVCVGENAAEPHHCPGKSRIEKGKSLLVDFGGDYENYNTDMTRNFYFGTPDMEYQLVYQILLEALELGKKTARVGNRLEDVDRAVRGYIGGRGYGEYFTHRTGHGIGIDCHEGPSVQEGEKTMISPGMTFSIEPGIYIPEKFGIRIEDQMIVTEEGTRALHSYPLKLVEIPC